MQKVLGGCHTVIAIEHAQDFVNAADYAVELSR